mmetsp:Transcript_6475/g.23063  ORF Transcript_6475/g.23063 Transcript_6475/m.23063 type:complete len:336 (+) Transcript_6475:1033-2040(+)
MQRALVASVTRRDLVARDALAAGIVLGHQPPQRGAPVHSLSVLDAQLRVLHARLALAVERKPRHQGAQHASVRLEIPLELAREAAGGKANDAAPAIKVGDNEPRHLRDDDKGHGLADAELAHAPRALRGVAQRHVLAERHGGAGVRVLFDVHARRVVVVKVDEELLPLHSAQRQRLGRSAVSADDDHRPIVVVEEACRVHADEAHIEHEARGLLVGESRHQRARVNERAEARFRVREPDEQRFDVPSTAHQRVRRKLWRRQNADDLAVAAGLETTRQQLCGQQVARRAAEADAALEQRVRAQLLPARAQLHRLQAHRRGEDVVAQVVRDGARHVA